MLIFSEQVKDKAPDTQRRLYALFQRAVKQGEIPALKLLTRFEIQGFKGQPRQVQDYAYTDETAQQVSGWIEQQQPEKANGFTVEQVQGLTDTELNAAIQQQTKGGKKRKPRVTKTTKKPVSTENEKTSQTIS